MELCVTFLSVAGHEPGQLYTYPARCWHKKKRLNILEVPQFVPIDFKIGKKNCSGWYMQQCFLTLKKTTTNFFCPFCTSLASQLTHLS